MVSKGQQLFRILRFFSVASLICILLAASLLTWLYRQAAIDGIVDFGERSNLMLSQSLLNAVEPRLSAYLANEYLHHSKPMPQTLADAIQRIMVDTSVVKVTILDDEGIVVYSTDGGLIGGSLRDKPGYQVAETGAVLSKVAGNEDFSLLDRGMGRATLINSYIPITTKHTTAIEGVFAVETNVRPLMAEMERTGYQVFFGSMAIMVLLYLALLAIVRYAERLIQGQQTQLQERSRALELLSSQLITVQESEKKRLANELHEGVAQTLSSIKLRLERASELLKERAEEGALSLEPVVPLVHDVIKEVRTLALDIRPPSLDEIGVLATVRWYGRDLSAAYPGLKLQQALEIEEEEIPAPIKVVLYRALQQRLHYLANLEAPLEVTVKLGKANDSIWLEIADDQALPLLDERQQEKHDLQLVTLREFLALSGSEVEIKEPNAVGGCTVYAAWPI